MGISDQIIIWTTLIAAVTAFLTAFVNLLMLLEMKKQRLLQTAPRIIIEGEFGFHIRVVNGIADIPIYPKDKLPENALPFRLMNVGAGDALDVTIDLDIISASDDFAKRDPNFKFDISRGFYSIRSSKLQAAYALSYLKKFAIGTIREDSDLPLRQFSVIDSIAMAYAEFAARQQKEGTSNSALLTGLKIPLKINFHDSSNTPFATSQKLTLDFVAMQTIENGFDLYMFLKAGSH